MKYQEFIKLLAKKNEKKNASVVIAFETERVGNILSLCKEIISTDIDGEWTRPKSKTTPQKKYPYQRTKENIKILFGDQKKIDNNIENDEGTEIHDFYSLLSSINRPDRIENLTINDIIIICPNLMDRSIERFLFKLDKHVSVAHQTRQIIILYGNFKRMFPRYTREFSDVIINDDEGAIILNEKIFL